MEEETKSLIDILQRVPKTKLFQLKEYLDMRFVTISNQLQTLSDTHALFRSQGAAQELQRMIRDIEYLLKS